MEIATKELLVSRILAGCLRCKIEDDEGKLSTYLIKKPTLQQLYFAQEMYQDFRQQLEEYGSMTEPQVIDFMIKEDLWSEEEEKKLKMTADHIEDFKVSLVKLKYKSDDKEKIRKYLAEAKKINAELAQKRCLYSFLSSSGAAAMLRSKYIVALSLFTMDGKQVYTDDSFWDIDNDFCDRVMNFYFNTRLNESQLRELARTDPWRGIWNGRKAEGSLFGKSSAELTDEQRALIAWSGIYDSVCEHPECPSDDIIEDDDSLDGWMIMQRRKRSDGNTNPDELIANEKIRGASEIFIPVNNLSDAKNVDKLNDDNARRTKKMRLKYVREKGEVHEANMPDSTLEIRQQINQATVEAKRG